MARKMSALQMKYFGKKGRKKGRSLKGHRGKSHGKVLAGKPPIIDQMEEGGE